MHSRRTLSNGIDIYIYIYININKYIYIYIYINNDYKMNKEIKEKKKKINESSDDF